LWEEHPVGVAGQAAVASVAWASLVGGCAQLWGERLVGVAGQDAVAILVWAGLVVGEPGSHHPHKHSCQVSNPHPLLAGTPLGQPAHQPRRCQY